MSTTVPSDRGRVTIREVAVLAGVSIGTVSNALNRPDMVSTATRERVLAAVQELSFQPNAAAQAMASNSSAAIGLVVTDMHNTLFVDIARGADEGLELYNRHLLMANSYARNSKQEWNVGFLASAGVSGIILAPINGSLVGFDEAKRLGKPLVIVDGSLDVGIACSVSADEELGGRIATQHLLDQDILRLAFVGDTEEWGAVADRYLGAQRTVAEDGRAITLELIETSGLFFADGYAVGLELAARKPADRPLGIIAAIDLLAHGILKGLSDAGGSALARGTAVVGYDDNYFAAVTETSITTVAKPGHEMGMEAARLLREELKHGHHHEHSAVVLKPSLIDRESSHPTF